MLKVSKSEARKSSGVRREKKGKGKKYSFHDIFEKMREGRFTKNTRNH